MKRIVPFLFLSILCTNSKGQSNPFLLYQDTLTLLQNRIYKEKTDEGKLKVNSQFLQTFSRALNIEKSFSFGFDSLKEIGRLLSPDQKFKIYNWNIPMNDGTQQYFGYLQVHNDKTKKYQVFSLNDKSSENKNPENTISDPTKWFGMLYYKIILKKFKKKTFYTLLAWDGNDRITTKKIIDVLSFDSKGTPRFGDAVFEIGKKIPKRVIYEYSSQTTISLKYNEELGMIIFDHLSPSQEMLTGQYQFYGPDGSFDAFEFLKGKWVYKADVDARNGKSQSDKLYKNPSEETNPKSPPKK